MTAHKSILLRTVLTALILGSVIAGAGLTTTVSAQSTTTPGPTTGPDPAENNTTSDSHWFGNGGGSGLLGGYNPLDPEEMYNETINLTTQGFDAALRWQINKSVSIWIGTPYDAVVGGNGPKSPTLTSINQIMGELRTSVYGPYVFQFLVLLIALFIIMSAVAIPASTMFYGASLSRWLAKIAMTIVIVGLAYDLINILQQTSNAIAWGIAPSAQELTSSMGGLFKLGSGPAVAILGLYFGGWMEALALSLVYAIRQIVLVMAPTVMPLILVLAYGSPHRRLRGFGSTMFWQWFNLCFVNIPVAIMLRLAFVLEWGFGPAGVLGFLMTLAVFFVALILPFVSSWAFFKYPPAITGAAAGAATKVESRVEESREDGWLNGGDDGDGGSQRTLSNYTNDDSRFGQWRDRVGGAASGARDRAGQTWASTKQTVAEATHIADDRRRSDAANSTVEMRKNLSNQYRDRRDK